MTCSKIGSAAALVSVLLVAGCAMWRGGPALPARYSVVRDQLIVYSDFSLPRHHRLLDELVVQRSDVSARLDLPLSDEPIRVFLFGTPRHFNAFIAANYPELPPRRAFFVESDTRLAVYAHWGDLVAEDLRHEVAHGYLHAVVPHVPLWLDEGLAEFFEVPCGQRGLNRPHLKVLLGEPGQASWQPDMAHLEGLRSTAEMSQQDYAQSWAWAHFLLESTDERRELLVDYLHTLRAQGSAPTLSEALIRLEDEPEQALLAHLRSLTASR